MSSRRMLDQAGWNGLTPDLGATPIEVVSAPPLTIVHVITRLLLGGAEENTVATCLHQAASGHRVTLVHGPGADPSWERRIGDRINLVNIDGLVHPISPIADLSALRALHRLYRQLKPDIVHTHESKAGIVGRVAAAAARVPLIVHTIHIAPFVAVSGAKRRLYIAAEQACARLSHGLIAVSRGMQTAYLEAGIGDGVPIAVIHSGMPLERFSSALPPHDWRRRIGGWAGDQRPRMVLKIAAFEERKRQLPLLRAMAAGLRQRRDVCLLFAGDGPDRLHCATEAQALGIADQVRFLGHDPAPWELVALADVCVHAAAREGLPRSAVQAIAGGKPLVVARLPGIEEVVADGINGIICDPDDLADLATCLFALLDSPQQLAQLQHGARSTDVSSWAIDKMGQRIDHTYASAATPCGAARRPITTIEFLGLPGSGKTTIARHLVALLREDQAHVRFSGDVMGDGLSLVRRSLRRLALVACAFVRHPGQMWLVPGELTPQQGGGKDALKTRWNFTSVLAMQSRPGPNGVLVADQGLAQAMWSARIHHGHDAAPAQALFDHIDGWIGATLFVHVEAPTSVARRRLGRRRQQNSRFQNAECIDDVALWDRGETVVEHLVAEIESELGRRGLADRLLRVSTSGDDTPLGRARHIQEHFRRLERDALAP